MCNEINNISEINDINNEDELLESLMNMKPSQMQCLKDILFAKTDKLSEESENTPELSCPDCSFSTIIKFGKNRLGKQRYRCNHCKNVASLCGVYGKWHVHTKVCGYSRY